MPIITNSTLIGRSTDGAEMFAWTEVEDGVARNFVEYITAVWLPYLGRFMSLTLVREIA